MFSDIISKGYFSQAYGYSTFPIFPLNNVGSLLITGLEYKHCLFLTIGTIELLSIVFVFLLGKSICNFKTGILAALFLSFYSANIAFGVHSIIAMSMGITFFSIICYLIIKNHSDDWNSIGIKLCLDVSLLFNFWIYMNPETYSYNLLDNRWDIIYNCNKFYQIYQIFKILIPGKNSKSSFERVWDYRIKILMNSSDYKIPTNIEEIESLLNMCYEQVCKKLT